MNDGRADSRANHPPGGALPGWVLAVVFAMVWWVLAEGRPGSWVVGLPAAVLAAAWSVRHRFGAQARPRPIAFVRFVPYFLAASIRGGIDVARLAVGPRRSVRSAFVPFKLALPPGPGRRTFINTLSLLPGTLSVRIDDDELRVHELLAHGSRGSELQAAERRVAPLFAAPAVDGAGARGAGRDG